MAAIISQLAANKRNRAKRIRETIPIDRSVYVLPPFDARFDPTIHNKYIKYYELIFANTQHTHLTLNYYQNYEVVLEYFLFIY